jgi:hypothetical protein
VMPQQMAIRTQALQAVARLPFTRPTVNFTAGVKATAAEVTYVNTPTYWWVSGVGQGEISKSVVLGVVAHAKPRGVSIVPGDGGAAVTCGWQTTHQGSANACATTYEKTSLYEGTYVKTLRTGQEVKAYQAAATPVWDIWITVNGKPYTVAGLPTSQTATPVTVVVPVDEIQSIVTGQRE